MSSRSPTIKFYNGNTIPALGLGTYRSKSDECVRAIKDAIDIGYRHFDCAFVYQNESEVGEALKAKIADGIVKREDLFITSKLWNTHHKTESVLRGINKTLQNLGLDYLDLYLVHWPMAYEEGDDLFPTGPDGKMKLTDTDYLDTWKGMEQVLEMGLTKNIGISNFNSQQITRLLENCKIKPVVNQVECHPYLTQIKLSDFCKANGIVITAYRPLGYLPKADDPSAGKRELLDDVKLQEVAKKYGKTTAQIIIRYQLDRGHAVIPKTITKSRLVENFEVLDFELTKDDITYINTFDVGRRAAITDTSSLFYPFNIPY